MAEISIGDIVARLRLDASEFQRGMQHALQSVTQFQQQMQAQAGGSSQASRGLQDLTQQVQGLSQGLRQGTESVTAFGAAWRNITQIAAGIGLATTIQGLVNSLQEFASTSLQVAARMQDLQRTLTALEGSSRQARETLGTLFETAQRAGVGFTTVTEAFVRLEAGARGTTLRHEELLAAMNNIALGSRVMGLSTQQVSSALVAFEQILTKGKLSAEELVRQLGNAVPGGLEKTARGLGITTSELRAMAEAGVIPGTVAFQAFATEMGRVGASGGPIEGITASINRLSNEWKLWQEIIGGFLANALMPMVDGLTSLLKVLRELGQTSLPAWMRQLLDLKGLFVPRPLNQGEANVQGVAPGDLPTAPSRFTEQIQAAARSAGIQPGIFSQLIRTESGFNPNAVSPAGAVGLGQLMPGTAESLQPGITREQLLDPARNLQLAARYLAQQMEHFKAFDDQVKLALAAYNAGPNRIDTLLERAQQMGLPQTFAGISQIPRTQGGLTQETLQYVPKVLEGTTTDVAAERQQNVNVLAEQYARQLDQTNQQFERLQQRVQRLATDTSNWGGYLNRDIAQQLQKIVDQYAQIATYIAAFPEQAQALGADIRQQVQERAREAVILQQTVLTEQGRRDLLRQQFEQLQQIRVQQQTQLVRERQGPEEAERFQRLETARMQSERLAERPTLAGLTVGQQITEYEQRIQALRNQVNALGADIEAQRVHAMRPGLEAELTRIETVLARPMQDLAEQARQRVLAQAPEIERQLATMLRQFAQHPAFQDLQERVQNIFQEGVGPRLSAQADIAFKRIADQQRDTIRQMADQVDQLGMKMGDASLSPLQARLARITREFEGWNDQLERMLDKIHELQPQVPPDQRGQLATLEDAITRLHVARQRLQQQALEAERARPETEYLTDLANRLERLQTPAGQQSRLGTVFGMPTPLDIELQQRQQTRQGEAVLQSPAARRSAQTLQEQIRQQERLNAAAQLFEEIGTGVGNAWTQALLGIANHTQTVSEAFRAMGQSIMQTLIQVTSQEGWRMLVSVGLKLLASALTSTTATAVSPSAQAAGVLPGGFETTFAQHGMVANRPTFAMVGEAGPEAVVNRTQMAAVMEFARQSGPSAGGQAMGGHGGISIINVTSSAEAERQRVQEQAQGRTVILNTILSDMQRGEGSQINRMIRTVNR